MFIYGRPESYVRNVTFDNVKVTHSKGMRLNFCDGILFKNCAFEVYNTTTGYTQYNCASTDEGIPALMFENRDEFQYKGTYTWQNSEPEPEPETETKTAILSWYMGENGTAATAANSITGASGCAAEGFTITITGNAGKNWSYGNGDITYKGVIYKTLKNSNGAQNTVLPEGQYAHKVEFYATTNADDGNGKLSEFNGTSCADIVTSVQNYANPTKITKEFTTGVNSFTFTFNTKQVCFIAVVTHSGEPDPSDPAALDPIFESSNPQIFKFIKDGHLIILRDGKTYTVLGTVLK